SRLRPVIENSPVLHHLLVGNRRRPLPVTHMRLANGSEIYVRSAFNTANATRGIDADFLFVDEFQDVAAGNLPVLEQSLSHSRLGRIILTGTPRTVDNHIEAAFNRGTANEWHVPCDCGASVL